MALTDLTIVRRSMTGRMFSTVTTTATVAVAVGLLLLLLSMKQSGRETFSRGVGDMHMLISNDSSPLVSVLNGVFYASAPANYITQDKYDELIAGVPFDYAVPIQLGDSYRGLPTAATTNDFFTRFAPTSGRPFQLAHGQVFGGSFQIVAGSEAARLAGLRVGDHVSIDHGPPRTEVAHGHDEFEHEVVGILEPTGTPHDRVVFLDLESGWVLHAHDRRERELGQGALTTAADLLPEDRKITNIYARLPSRDGGVPAALPQILRSLRSDPELTVAEPAAEIRSLFEIVGNVDKILIGMAVAVMISSGIAIMLALYNSMEQRRRQIAVLRVLGASRERIFGLVMTESAILGCVGGVAGVLIALVGSRVVSGVMEASLGLVVEPTLDLPLTLLVVIATIALAAVAGLVPAIAGYRTSVARNLRPIG